MVKLKEQTSMLDIQKEVIRITSEYFNNIIDYSKLSITSEEYKSILNELCGEDMNIEEGRKSIVFESGKALGTHWAALCLDDFIRTRQFIRGINEAIKEKLNNRKPLHVLYAGTGPFATLILPLILRYSKRDIKYTLMEINPFSFRVLQNVIFKIGLEEYDITCLNEDATKYQIDPENEPDIIISETMQNALAKEQQVPIFLNLMSQIRGDSIFIPEKIELFIGLKEKGIPIEELHRKHYLKEKKILEVSKEAMFPSDRSEQLSSKEVTFAKMQTVIGAQMFAKYGQVFIITEIQVYKNEKIAINESGLTLPLFIQNISINLKGPIIIDTEYKISSEPKLEYKISLPNDV